MALPSPDTLHQLVLVIVGVPVTNRSSLARESFALDLCSCALLCSSLLLHITTHLHILNKSIPTRRPSSSRWCDDPMTHGNRQQNEDQSRSRSWVRCSSRRLAMAVERAAMIGRTETDHGTCDGVADDQVVKRAMIRSTVVRVPWALLRWSMIALAAVPPMPRIMLPQRPSLFSCSCDDDLQRRADVIAVVRARRSVSVIRALRRQLPCFT